MTLVGSFWPQLAVHTSFDRLTATDPLRSFAKLPKEPLKDADMDLRSLTIGLVCGAFIGALAVWLIGGNGGAEVILRTESEAEARSIPQAVTVLPTGAQEFEGLPSESKSAESHPQSSIEIRVDPVSPWPEYIRAELESETKDDSWAYYMEQTLLQFLGAHSAIDQFDISRIECRTTQCQIEVFGFDESTVPVWHQVMYEIRQQSWSEFDQYGTSSGDIDGRLAIVSTLHRKVEP